MPNLFIFLPWNQSSTEHSAYERGYVKEMMTEEKKQRKNERILFANESVE